MTEPTYGRGFSAYDDASPSVPAYPLPSAIGTAPPEDLTVREIAARAHGKRKRRTARAAMVVVRAVETLAAHEACARKRGRATRLRGVRGKGVCAECGKGGTRALWQVQILKGGR
jgi:hypothetical protein